MKATSALVRPSIDNAVSAPEMKFLLPTVKNALLFINVVQKTSLILSPEPRPSLRGMVVMYAEVVVDDVPPVDREHQAVGVGLVGVALLAERPVLELAAGRDQLVLVLADQAIAGNGLEVADVADGGDATPCPLDAEEALEQELVGDVGEDAADVDGR